MLPGRHRKGHAHDQANLDYAIVLIGTVALGIVAPRIAVILNALVPVILIAGIAAAVLRVVWFYTRRW